jgi:hypothetical protein
VLQARVEQVERRPGILANRSRGVLARPGGIRNPGEVEDGVAAGHELAGFRPAGVHANDLELGRGGARGAPGSRHGHDVVAALREKCA